VSLDVSLGRVLGLSGRAGSFGVLIKFIDQAAVNNAFLSGMKEDLHRTQKAL